MRSKKIILPFKSVKARLVFWLFIISISPLLVTGGIVYNQRLRNIQTMQFAKLEVIRDLKVREINRWIEERLGDIVVAAGDFQIRNLEKILRTPGESQDKPFILNNADRILKRHLVNYRDYLELFIINSASGMVELSTDAAIVGMNRSNDLYFTEPIHTGESYIKDIYYSPAQRKPAMAFSAPIRCLAHNGEHIIGVLVARVDLESSLYDLLLNRTGMGNTGETLIVNRDAVALNELRWQENAPLRLKIEAEPAEMAAGGKTGITETVDYRGEKVLAAYTHISRTGWGFVAKQDLSEVYKPIAAMRTSFLIILAVALLAIYLAAMFLSSSFVRPIGELAEAHLKLQRGDKEARSGVDRHDEFGFLAHSFNAMADSLKSQIKIRQGSADLSALLVKANSLDSLGRKMVNKLLDISDAQFGVIYLYDKDEKLFNHLASIGINEELLKSFSGDKFTGEFGRVLATKKIYHVREIPEDTLFTFRTTAGTAVPRELLAIPIMSGDRVTALISLGSLRGFTPESLEVLNQSWTSLNMGFSNLLAWEESKSLAEKLRLSNEELTSINEELQYQSEELQQQKTELETKRVQVEEANRLKSEFLSNMSHELRTPLNSIMALSQLIIAQGVGKDPGQETEYLKVIERNGLILLNLINEILDLSRIEVGQMEIHLSDFTPEDVVRRVVETTRPIVESKSLELVVRIGQAPVVHSDEEKLQQILLNLLSNAVKFTEKGSIEMALSEAQGEVSFTVRDTGIGISESELESIFEEFRQLDGSTTRKYEGVGLGLSISQKLASLLGGKITVQSRPGKGSVFTLVLPTRYIGSPEAAQITAAGAPLEPLTREAPGTQRESPLILVVEDNEIAVLQIRSALEESGCTIAVARGGAEAIEIMAGQVPDLMILDLMMAEVDGFQVLEQIRSRPLTARLPVLVLTARELTADDRSRLSHNNIEELIQKGNINRVKLLASVARILDKGSDSGKALRKKELKASEKPPATPFRKNSAILVVEDNRDNLLTITAILDRLKYKHREAGDGEAAVKMAAELKPALILMDVQLPLLSGIDAARLIKADPELADIPIIALTAKAMKGDREELLAAGCDDYLSKPLNLDEFTVVLKKWMRDI